MVGVYVNQFRDLGKPPEGYPNSTPGSFTAFYQPRTSSGPGQEYHVRSLIPHQRTRSWRSGGDLDGTLDKNDYHNILVGNIVQFHWPFDNGHEFSTSKTGLLTSSHEDYTARGFGGSYYRGPLHATDPVPFYTGHNSPDGSDRIYLSHPNIDITIGTKFLRDTLPGKSQANLSQLIAELVIDLPRIPFDRFDHKLYDRRNLPKNIGSEYLNTVFGWRPLVSDVLKVCEAIVKIDDIIAQYQKDSGPEKTVRRRRKIPRQWDTASSVVSNNIRIGYPLRPTGNGPGADVFRDIITGTTPTQANGFLAHSGQLTVQTGTSQKYEFVARWMYYLGADSPVLDDLRRAAQFARKTLGIRLDLELLWELAPWTWMLDWFANIGDLLVVNDAIARDSQVLQYAYLERETTVSARYTHTGVLFGGRVSTGPITSSIDQIKKERVRATPYGFGVNLNGLSPSQLAILAALAASGSNRSSRL